MKLIQKWTCLSFFLAFFIFVFTIPPALAAEDTQDSKTETQKPSHYLVATYFHNTFRCPTCKHIEEYSARAIENNFPEEMKNGRLVWRVINVDEPENQHYNKDYQLFTKSLIISEIKDGKETRWKNLEKVWTYVRDEEKFEQYITSEINAWLKE
jgi:hypothetical protein